MIPDETIKEDIVNRNDYLEWNRSIIDLEELKGNIDQDVIEPNLIARMRSFGYDRDNAIYVASSGIGIKDPLGSMGNDGL